MNFTLCFFIYVKITPARNKRHLNGKGESQLVSVCVGHDIIAAAAAAKLLQSCLIL